MKKQTPSLMNFVTPTTGVSRIAKAMSSLTTLQDTFKQGIDEVNVEAHKLAVERTKLDEAVAILDTARSDAEEALANVQAILPNSMVKN